MGEAAAAAASGIKLVWTGRVVVGAGLGKTAAGFADESHGWRSDTVQVAVIGGGFHDLDDHPDKQNIHIYSEGDFDQVSDQVSGPSGQAPTNLPQSLFSPSSQHPSETSKTTAHCTFPMD
ncbi:hypothetical protein BO85DRAFT_463045 [Aspergillus piperis CBS 112811]|uniref:Uncharacterized protein n=1 Tax=Aspergillus piperis CBS 112811 TaxID=1448313 RepID=A0A8G1QUR4_9EURO|nr:hypothetical protein BO85DRAFT_463045 [Aspergillus piperis CBS 112811]RAH53341.1 hypothetical protein BO85DRAFT_463045 [Aspergillus piperis CBS 112811]